METKEKVITFTEEEYIERAETFFSVWINDFKRQYHKMVACNDPAHQWEHFKAVYDAGVVLNYRTGCRFQLAAIFLVAHLHDLFAWSRVNHEKLSYAYVTGNDNSLVDTLIEIAHALQGSGTLDGMRQTIALACLEHRSSYRGGFSSEFSELMNAADYELPSGLETMLKRAYVYAWNKDNVHEEAVRLSVQHMADKFGRGGYARYPQIYIDQFGDDLEDLYNDIDELTMDSPIVLALAKV